MKKKPTKKVPEPIAIDIFILNKYIESVDPITTKNQKTTMTHQNQEYALAKKLSDALNEPENFNLYLKFAKTVPKEFLLKKLNYVLSNDSIENKAAYFNSVVQKYGYKA